MLRRVGTMVIAGALLGAFALIAWGANGASTASALTNCDTSEAGITPAEQQMLDLVNGARAQAGLGALKFSPTLNQAAAWKSADASASGPTFDHTDSTGRNPFTRMANCGYAGSGFAGENIAYGSSNPSTIFGMWMDSDGHRRNILLPGYTVTGLAVHNGAWTQDFGHLDDSGAPPPPPPASPTITAPTATSTAANTPATPANSPPPTSTPTRTPSPTPSPTATRPPAPVNIAGVTLPLSAGMNLVTYSGPAQPVANALSSVRGSLASVYEWEAATGRWLKYAAGLPAYVDSFTSMEPGRVYYIELRAPEIWTY